MRKAFVVASTLLAGLGIACSGAQEKKPKDPLYEEVDVDTIDTGEETGGASCTDPSGEPLECLSDEDCCEGFYCGIDPQGSTRIKTCLDGGG